MLNTYARVWEIAYLFFVYGPHHFRETDRARFYDSRYGIIFADDRVAASYILSVPECILYYIITVAGFTIFPAQVHSTQITTLRFYNAVLRREGLMSSWIIWRMRWKTIAIFCDGIIDNLKAASEGSFAILNTAHRPHTQSDYGVCCALAQPTQC